MTGIYQETLKSSEPKEQHHTSKDNCIKQCSLNTDRTIVKFPKENVCSSSSSSSNTLLTK